MTVSSICIKNEKFNKAGESPEPICITCCFMHDFGSFGNNHCISVIRDIVANVMQEKWRSAQILDRNIKETLDLFPEMREQIKPENPKKQKQISRALRPKHTCTNQGKRHE